MSGACPSCKSARCGNHAACARRRTAAEAAWRNLTDLGATLGLIGVVEATWQSVARKNRLAAVVITREQIAQELFVEMAMRDMRGGRRRV